MSERGGQEYRLIQAVMEQSVAKQWSEARREWGVGHYTLEEDETCVCGKRHIQHCYCIVNRITRTSLYPIGSECIKRFSDERLEGEMKALGLKFKILKDEGGKHHGKTFGHIYDTDQAYFVHVMGESRRVYGKLRQYYWARKDAERLLAPEAPRPPPAPAPAPAQVPTPAPARKVRSESIRWAWDYIDAAERKWRRLGKN